MKVKVKKIKEKAILPTKGSEFSAGSDLYACLDETIHIKSNETKMIPTGLSIELPVGTVGLIYARSGLATKRDLAPANKVGVIDSDYRGEVMIALHNHGKEEQSVHDGERIAQMVVSAYYDVTYEESDKLEPSQREKGDFGSTG